MPKASDIKKGSAIEHNGKVYFVKEITKLTPFKTDEIITLADFSRRSATFSYVDGNEYVFMDSEDYTPYTFNKEAIEEELLFISEDTQGLQILIVDGVPVAIELPSAVDLEIVDTAPSIKGASASARTKPATMTTGLTVQVPEYIANGEKVKINTAEHKFMSRA